MNRLRDTNDGWPSYLRLVGYISANWIFVTSNDICSQPYPTIWCNDSPLPPSPLVKKSSSSLDVAQDVHLASLFAFTSLERPKTPLLVARHYPQPQ